jgi:hypothetical protein
MQDQTNKGIMRRGRLHFTTLEDGVIMSERIKHRKTCSEVAAHPTVARFSSSQITSRWQQLKKTGKVATLDADVTMINR